MQNTEKSPILPQLLIASIIVPVPVMVFYDYKIPDNQTAYIGQIVKIPIGKRLEIGVIADISNKTDCLLNKLKSLIIPDDSVCLPKPYMDFILRMSAYNMIPAGDIIKPILRFHDDKALKSNDIFYEYVDKPLLSRLTPKRQIVMDYLKKHGKTKSEDLKSVASPAVISGLCEQGIIQKIIYPPTHSYQKPNIEFLKPTFGHDQITAIKSVRDTYEKMDYTGFKPYLLDGITGSGKTEVFLEIAGLFFKQSKQVLILVPEIGLTQQTAMRFEKRFGTMPALWHSGTTDKDKRLIYQGIRDGTISCVIAARSGLFLPFKNLGLIIIDEEHDTSYKQEEGIRYNARDMAVMRAKCENIPIILASATPSLESYVNAEMERYEKLILRERFGGAILPDIKLVNMQNNMPSTGKWISPILRDAVNDTANRGEQSLLFINRRGYAPLMLCRGCGYRIQCPHCSVWVVYHQKSSHLKCHQCGQSSPIPKQCPSCGAVDKFTPCGPGVERLYEEVTALFPHLRCEILSSDYFDNPDALDKILTQIHNGHIHILIGTQMIAKGHDFPHLTTVGIIDADLGLNGGDLRAGERSFQLLEQVSGRAGRSAGKHGTVYIQSYNPQHPVMQALVNKDRDSFLDTEAQIRLDMMHPPFGRLAALIISGEDNKQVFDFVQILGKQHPFTKGITVYGPAAAAIAVLRGRYRYRFLIKSGKNYNIQDFIKYWLSQVKIPYNIRVHIDIDPISFL